MGSLGAVNRFVTAYFVGFRPFFLNLLSTIRVSNLYFDLGSEAGLQDAFESDYSEDEETKQDKLKKKQKKKQNSGNDDDPEEEDRLDALMPFGNCLLIFCLVFV